MTDGPTAPEGRIVDAFNAYFSNFDIRIEASNVAVGTRHELCKRGWRITLRVDPDDAGSPSIEFYATNWMTDDRDVRIWADGRVERLELIREGYAYNPEVQGSKDSSEREYLTHNRKIADELRAAGLFPEGDINAYLRTGGNEPEVDGDQICTATTGQSS
jgi:hypothetical protein